MSQQAQILDAVRAEVAAALAGHGEGGDSDAGDVTQLKRENTGLRNRVKALEEGAVALEARVKALEDSLRPVPAPASPTKAHGSK